MNIVTMLIKKWRALVVIGAVVLLGSGCMVMPYGYDDRGYHGHHGYPHYRGYDYGYRNYRYR